MDKQQIPRGKRMPTQILFMINGIASLLGYNALLTSLDYFEHVYKGYDVYSLFLPPVFLGYVVMVLSFRWLTYKYTYKTLVTFGIILCNFSLTLLLILSLTCKQAKGFGFGVSIFAGFLLGMGANSYQLTFFAQINYLSESVVSKFTIGTALGGLGITVLRMIIVAIAGTDDSLTFPIILYFIIAILFNFFTLFSNWSFFKSREYKIKIVPYLNHYKQDMTQKLNVSSQEKRQEQAINKGSIESEDVKNEEDVSYFRILLQTGKSIFPYPILIFGNYIMTFLVFPNLTIHKTYDNLEFVWSSLIFFLIYNVGDTLGKFICEYRWSFNSYSVIYMFSTRAYFVVVIPLLATTIFDEDPLVNNYYFPYIVQFLFSLTNGIVTNASFIQSFQICPLKYKKYAGVLGGITLQVGILVGTNLAIPFSKLFISDA